MNQKIVGTIVSVAMIAGLAVDFYAEPSKVVVAEEVVTLEQGTNRINENSPTTGVENQTTGEVETTQSDGVKRVKPTVILKKKNFPYKKKGKYKPEIIVKDGTQVLPKSDYSVKYPKAKKIGTYKVKVTLKGNYSGTAYAVFHVTPHNTKIAKLRGLKGGVLVLWKGLMGEKFNQMSGYEVACSTSKDFKNKKTQKCSKSFRLMQVRKLKSKKVYYVKLRTFKFIGKKKLVYSTWSSPKRVKTK